MLTLFLEARFFWIGFFKLFSFSPQIPAKLTFLLFLHRTSHAFDAYQYNQYLFDRSKFYMFHTMQRFPNWAEIKQILSRMAERKLKPEDIITETTKFKQYSIVDRKTALEYQRHKTFMMLYKKYSHELQDIYQQVARFVLSRPNFQIPLFKQGENKEFVFTKEKILYLYCSMVLCLIPNQQFDLSAQTQGKFHYLLDFSSIFEDQEYKTLTIIEYLKKEINNVGSYGEKLVIRRSCENRTLEEIVNENKDKPMAKLVFQDDQASIERNYGSLKADFANRYLGGGALGSGCVQEEIMFANHPELFTAQLLCEVMKPNECIFLSGFKKYFSNSGYGFSTSFRGFETHKYAYDAKGMAREYITAIDAQPFGQGNWQQFRRKWIDRQLLKAYVGFNFKQEGVNSVATGNWGCGVFGGDLRTKFLVQWIACSMADKQMIYCPFGSSAIIRNQQLFSRLQALQVGKVYEKLCQASQAVFDSHEDFNIYKAMEKLV